MTRCPLNRIISTFHLIKFVYSAGLEHLPVPATRHGPSNLDKDRIQIADESGKIV